MSTAIDFLKKHESVSPSHFEENAKWRKENRAWLEWSRNIALSLVEYMESNGLNRNGWQSAWKFLRSILVKSYLEK